MNSLTFLNPALLWGLGLMSIPIIIHLLFRRQFKRVEWAPMRYLKLTIQRNRRRVQLEQLILLLLRMALIGILFLLIARPAVNLSGISSWFGGGTRTSHFLVLDDSLSADARVGEHTVFERELELATRVVRDLEPQDRFTLVLASQPKQPLLREVEVFDADQVVQLLRKQKPSGAFVAWSPVMTAVDELVKSSTYPTHEVTLLTDCRRAGWETSVKETADRWTSDGLQLRIFNLGGESPQQVALTELRSLDPCAIVGVPARWEAVVRNGGSQTLDRVEATVLVDGKPNPLVLPQLPAGQSVKVPLTAVFQEPGLHNFSLQLPRDDLQLDNQRWSVADVRERLRIVLVDGQPSNEPLQNETDFLALALSLGGEESAGFQIEMMTDAELASLSGEPPDVLVLANVATVTMQQAQRLRTLVDGGMGLIIFVGDQIDPDAYNQLLSREGIGLLPAQLESISDQAVEGLVLEKNSPSPLDALRQLSAAVLERVKTNKYFLVRASEDPASGVRILARWNDSEASPAVVERTVGRGRVVLWTTTANKAWGDWPTQPSYVLTMRESAKAIVRSEGAHEVMAGEPIRRFIPAEVQVSAPTIEVPESTEPVAVSIDSDRKSDAGGKAASAAGGSSERFLAFAETNRPGLYRLNWQANPGGQMNDTFAANPDVRESDLTPIANSELRALWGTLEPEIVSADSSGVNLATRGEEIWRPLAMCLLAFLAIEACFATFAGRQR
jgi:hypothetical protein